MSIEKAKEFLEQLQIEKDCTCGMCRGVNGALDELSKQPEPSEFTAKMRRMYLSHDAKVAMPQDWQYTLDACAIIDRQAEENKRLKDIIAKGFNEAVEVLLEKLQAENEGLKEAWAELRPRLEAYNYEVGGVPTVIMQSIARFEQALTRAS